MTKRLSIHMAALLSMFFIASVGCDFGTYQQRASEPVPSDVQKVGETQSNDANS